MKHRDRQIGRPSVVFKNTKSYIESIVGVEEGAIAYATDTDELGYYNGTEWVWGSGGGGGIGDMLKSVYDTDDDGIVDSAESVPWSGVTGKPSTFPPDEHGHTFIGLTDTPSSYSGSSGKAVKVKSTEDGLEFGAVGDMLKSTYDTNDDGIVDAAETVPWDGVTGKPSTFPPDEHDHSLSGDVGGSLSNTVVSALRGKPIVDPLSPSKEDIIKWDGTKYISDKESFYKMVVFSAFEGSQLLGTCEFNEDNLRYHLEADWPFLIYLPPGSVTFSSPVTLGNARKTLIGKGPNLTSLVGQINGGNLVMSGITVYAEASGTVNSVLNFGSGSVDLDDCRIILDNANYPGYAIRLHGNSYLGKISNCVISVLYDDESSTAFGVFDSAVGSEVYFSVIDAVPVYPSSSDKIKFYGCLFPKYSPENIPQTMLAAGDRARITSERFIGLVDAPSSYSGQAQKIVRVKSSEDGLEFAEGGGGAQTFLQLTDTPSSYSGFSFCPAIVSSDSSSLEFGKRKIAFITRTSSQSIPNNTWTSVTFSDSFEMEYNATLGYWNSSQPTVINFLDRGIFLVIVRAEFAANGTGYRGVRLNFGSQTRAFYIPGMPNPPVNATEFVCLVNIGTLDSPPLYATVSVIQNSGGALNMSFATVRVIYLYECFFGGNFII